MSTDGLEAWIGTGRIVDLILVMIVLEAGVLVLIARLPQKLGRIPLRGLLFNLAAGGFLLLALRAVVHEASVVTIGLWLTMALLAHLADLVERLRRRS